MKSIYCMVAIHIYKDVCSANNKTYQSYAVRSEMNNLGRASYFCSEHYPLHSVTLESTPSETRAVNELMY